MAQIWPVYYPPTHSGMAKRLNRKPAKAFFRTNAMCYPGSGQNPARACHRRREAVGNRRYRKFQAQKTPRVAGCWFIEYLILLHFRDGTRPAFFPPFAHELP
jgi:hypothetical protein